MRFEPDFEPPTEDNIPNHNGVIHLPQPAPSRATSGIAIPDPLEPKTAQEDKEADARQRIANILRNTANGIEGQGRPKEELGSSVQSMQKLVAKYLPASAGGLPPIKRLSELMGSRPIAPPELISGILHQGSKMVLGGGSKSYKTWALIDLGLSVASGTAWWGFRTVKRGCSISILRYRNTFS